MPVIDRILVDRKEYEALCALRDGAHEDVRLKLAIATENARQATHLAETQAVELENFRAKNLEQHKLIHSMMKRLAELEPVRSSVQQPMFARSR